MKEAEQSESSEYGESDSDQDIDAVCKEVCLAEGVGLMAKCIIIGVAVKNHTVQFRLDTGADVSLMNEESWNVLGKQKLSDVTGRLRNASRRLTKFRGVFTASCGHVSWHGNTSAIPCKVWCEYLLGKDCVTKTGLSYVCVTFLKSLARGRQVMAAGRVVAAVNSSIQVLNRFSKVFQDGLGC